MSRSPSSRRSFRSGGAMPMLRRRGLMVTCLATVALGAAAPAGAQAVRVVPVVERHASLALRGRVTGSVSDDRGGPLRGAMISMLGVTMATTVTDDAGRFTLDALPAGDYILRAHMSGFAASPRQLVRVGAAPADYRLQ